MRKLRDLIADNEDWLIDRVVSYAKEQGYTEFTSTLKEAWRASICGLSEPLITALDVYDAPPEFSAHEDFARHPIAAFGVEQARQHRARGVTLSLFLGLTKYYRQAYTDLIASQGFPAEDQAFYRTFIERFFDLIELGFCSEWSNVSESDKLGEIQERNRVITNEKNKYLTIFESLNDPVILLDETGAIQNLNYAAHALFIGPDDPGAIYYGNGERISLEDQIDALIARGDGSESFDVPLETKSGERHFHVRVQRMLDISEKYLGTVLILNDITEHKRARDQAEAANRMKSAFLATMSHEIRTPISGVLGMADLLCDTPLDDQQKHYLSGIATSGNVLMGVLNDILDYSKIEAGVLDLETVDFDLGKVLSEVREVMEPDAAGKSLAFEIEIGNDLPEVVRGDPGKIRQVLLNLTNNAVKFTAAGSVTMRAGRSDTVIRGVPGLRFDVVDTGIGIPETDSERLFEPFTQQDTSTSRLFGGTGLGLTICRRLVQVMGGTIDCRLNDNGGSTFGFEVPLYEGVSGTYGNDRQADTWTSRPLSVLLVEDNAVNRLVSEGFLERRNHDVVAAGDGEEALEILEHRSFDLILLDQRMPGMSGLELLRRLRASPMADRAAIPVIVISASVIPSEMELCLKAGADGFLGKPFTQAELDGAIATCLSDRGMVNPSSGPGHENDATTLIDPAVLKGHLDVLGRDRTGRILAAFFDTTPHVIDDLDHDLGARDFDMVADHAHGLKSAANNVGLVRVADLAAKLEIAARDHDADMSAAIYPELRTTYSRSLAALDRAWSGRTSAAQH